MNWHHLLQPTREGCLPRCLPPAKAAPFVLHLEATHPYSLPPLSSKNLVSETFPVVAALSLWQPLLRFLFPARNNKFSYLCLQYDPS
ncbi:hypothetical protein JHK85_016189 [Glycine max]|nr:hypothetical protein JHK85_016189 [Glycine max]